MKVWNSTIERHTPLKQHTPMKKVNPARRKVLYLQDFGVHADLVRSLCCCVCGALPPSEAHHVKSRGAGGTRKDLAPLCARCHRLGHVMGWTSFGMRFGVNLEAEAKRLWEAHGD